MEQIIHCSFSDEYTKFLGTINSRKDLGGEGKGFMTSKMGRYWNELMLLLRRGAVGICT